MNDDTLQQLCMCMGASPSPLNRKSRSMEIAIGKYIPYEFIGCWATDGRFPYEFIGVGARDDNFLVSS